MTNLRDVFLAEVDKWSFPASEWELAAVKEIIRLPVITVYRVDNAKLELMSMKPRECHANARFMEENDPEGRTKRILGWWPQDGTFVLHSIVNHRGQYLCFTPVDETLVCNPQFEFLPDSKIEMRLVGEHFSYYRHGVEIGPGIRREPAQFLADSKIVRERLSSGMDPHEALRFRAPR